MFALFNKVAGVYGLIAVLTGAGGSAAQLSLYIYSTVALVALSWGLKAVKKEDPRSTLYVAHLFFADHILSTSWTAFFAVSWWLYTPHDGVRVSNSPAQEAIVKNYPGELQSISDEERAQLATELWNREKGFALTLIALGWLLKIYLALLIYSYAIHLRKGSYRNLPHSRPNVTSEFDETALIGDDDDDEEIEDFYRVPVRTPQSTTHSPAPNGSPGRSSNRLSGRNHSQSIKQHPISRSSSREAEVLFDERDLPVGGQSKYGLQEGEFTAEDEHAPFVSRT